MSLQIADRVKETTTTTGVGALDLTGAPLGFQRFAVGIGNSNTCYYAIVHRTLDEWEVGLGTVGVSPDTLSRGSVSMSSNSGNLVDFSSGIKDVFVTLPASGIVQKDLTGDLKIASLNREIIVDGITYAQDSAGIIAAIAALPAEGGVVFLPEATYLISATVDIDTKSNILIRGAGFGTILKLADNITAASLGDMLNICKIVDSNNITIKDLTLDGNFDNQSVARLAVAYRSSWMGEDAFVIQYTGAGSAASLTISGDTLTTTCTGAPGDDLNLDLTAAANDTLVELKTVIEAYNGGGKYTVILNAKYPTSTYTPFLTDDTYADIKSSPIDILLANTSVSTTHEVYGNDVYVVDSDHIRIDRCNLKNAPHMGVYFAGGVTNSTVANCYGSYCGWRSIQIWSNSGDDCYGNLIQNNTFNECMGTHIIIEDQEAFDNCVSGNVLTKADSDFDDTLLTGINIFNSSYNTLSTNVLKGCGIRLDGLHPDYNSVTGNVVDGNSTAAAPWISRTFWLRDGKYNIISGNIFTHSNRETMQLTSGASNNQIDNNLLHYNDTPKNGIYIEAGSNNNRLLFNSISEHSMTINDLGTGTTIINTGDGQFLYGVAAEEGVGWNGENIICHDGDVVSVEDDVVHK